MEFFWGKREGQSSTGGVRILNGIAHYQCQAISEKTAMPRTTDSSDESLLFQTVRDVTAVLFSRLLLTDFLQHNCSTLGEKDLSFGRRYLCFTFLS